MKFLITFILIALLSFAAGIYFPWWSLAIVGFVVGIVIPQSGWSAFFAGFLSVAILWTVLSLMLSIPNEHILARRVAPIFVKTDSPFLLILVTALIGGLVGGFATLTGNLLQSRKKVS